MTGTLKSVEPGGGGVLPTWESLVWGVRPDGTRRPFRLRAQFRTRKEAEAWHSARQTAANDGKLETARDVKQREMKEREREAEERERAERERKAEERETVAALLDDWFKEHKKTLQGATAVRYCGLVEGVKRVLPEGITVHTFTRVHAKQVFTDFGERGGVKGRPQGSSSTRQARVCLGQALDMAAELGIIAANPMRGMKRLKLAPTAERQPPSVEEVRRLLDACSLEANAEFLVPVALAVGCGMRRGEVFGGKWSAADLDKGTFDVREAAEEYGKHLGLKSPKTARSKRTIALPAFVIAALRLHRQRQREWALLCGPGYDRSADLINAAPDGKLVRMSGFTDRYKAFAASLGVKGTHHDLRHAHASALVASGVDARSVSNRLGHASVGFTMQRYVHAGSESDRRAAAAFDAILRGPAEASANEGRA